MFRVTAAALLLLVQASGLVHVATARHGGDALTLVDVLREDSHSGDHVCAAPEDQTETCAVFAQWRQLAPGEATPVFFTTREVFEVEAGTNRDASRNVDALTVAPKGSPPFV